MYCSECGNEVFEAAKFCQKCGTSQTKSSSSTRQADDRTSSEDNATVHTDSELNKYPQNTVAQIKCHHCEYVGQMGIVAEEYSSNWWMMLGIVSILCIVCFTLFSSAWHCDDGFGYIPSLQVAS
jgi:hypothetical protein